MRKQIRPLQAVARVRTAVKERFDTKTGRSLQITGASCIGNTCVGLGKLLMGIFSLSFFTCVSAFYTFGMVIAKCCALWGLSAAASVREQQRYYLLSGAILTGASALYIAYSLRLFFRPASTVYDMNVALAIAAFTFTELTLNIRGVILERRSPMPLMHAIKTINLASSLICLVLTQTAILSFSDPEQVAAHASANGLIGVIMGAIATLLGVLMMMRHRKRTDRSCGNA